MASIAEEQKHANDEDKTLADEIVVKSGYLQKLGGGDGGRQNWKKRFFVYKTKTLEYYENEKDHTAGKKYKGVIVLDCYYAAQNETKGQDAEFSIYAYPKNMTCRGSSPQEMNEWIDILNQPGKE